MQILEPDVQLYILERLAQFATPTQIQKEVEKRWEGLAVSLQAISAYKPGTLAGNRLSAEHKAVFDAARAAFNEARQHIGLANATYRLQVLQDIIDHPQFGQNPFLKKDVVEMVEKIEGGLYRQRQNGVPLAEVTAHISELMADVRDTIAKTVSDPAAQHDLLTAIDKRLESRIQQGSV